MDYFEIRYEIQENNKRYFYQLDDVGIRYGLIAFARASQDGRTNYSYATKEESIAICKVTEDYSGSDVVEI